MSATSTRTRSFTLQTYLAVAGMPKGLPSQLADEPSKSYEMTHSATTWKIIDSLHHADIPYGLILRLIEQLVQDASVYSAAILVFLPGLYEIRRVYDLLMENPQFSTHRFRVIGLHSAISTDNQGLVFEIPPQGVRKIVLCV